MIRVFKYKMMNIKKILFVFVAGVFFVTACQKNTDIFVPDPGQPNGPDTSWKSIITVNMPVSVLKNNLILQPYQDSINVNSNIASIVTPFGIQVNFPPNSCATAAGQIIIGKVQVELILVKKKGDMIRLNLPTTNNDSLLVTAGQIFIRLKREGQIVQLAPNVRINITYVDLPVNPQMKLFMGDESNAERFNWLPNPDLVNNTIIAGTQAYQVYTNRLRWISIAQVFDVTNTSRVYVAADLAPYFTNTNTVAFTVFNDMRSVVAMHGDLNTRKFISGKLPVGKQITVVVISKQGSDYYLGFKSATTTLSTTGPVNQLVHVVPIKRSLPEILAYLSSL
jgi:hypothetical protein